MDSGRRRFLTRYWREELTDIATGFARGVRQCREESEFDSFFESYESSYALTLAYPDEILLESARRAGIEVEGKERREIVKELFRSRRGR